MYKISWVCLDDHCGGSFYVSVSVAYRCHPFSVAKLCPTLCDPVDCSMPGFPVLHQFPELAQTHVHWIGDAIQPASFVVPFSFCLQSLPASVSFSIESVLRIRWPKYWSFTSASVLPRNIQDFSFRIDCFDILAVQGTLKSLLQHHSSKASILWHFLYSPTLTSIHDYWKNHTFD